MRKAFILIFALSACQNPNTKKENVLTKEEQQIAKELIQGSFDNVWSGTDTTQVARYHTDDFMILEHGEIWDNNQIKAYMKSQEKNKNRPLRKNSMEYISIEKYGNSIQMAYHNNAEFTRADTLVLKLQWLESALAIKTKEGWRLKMMHSTRVPIKNKK